AIAIQRVHADAGRIGVVEPSCGVEVLVVVGYPNLRSLCGRAAKHGRVHRERQRWNRGPSRLVRHAVDVDGALQTRKHQWGRGRRLCTSVTRGDDDYEWRNEWYYTR